MKSTFQQMMEDKVTSLLKPAIQESGFELVELKLVRRKSSSLLQLLIDKVGGITLDECAELSRQLSYLLEVDDPIEGRFILEVSSPGLDRPLTTEQDFRIKIGERVLVRIKSEGINSEVTGEIVAVEHDHLVLKTDSDQEKYPLTDIVQGKILF